MFSSIGIINPPIYNMSDENLKNGISSKKIRKTNQIKKINSIGLQYHQVDGEFCFLGTSHIIYI